MNTDDSPVFSEFRALGTRVEVGGVRPERLEAVTAHVVEKFEQVERTFSRFRGDSELAFVEGQAGRETRCSALFAELLRLACWAASSTGGWFDPTIRDALEAAGYDRDIAALEAVGPGPDRPALPAGRWRSIRVDVERQRVWLPPGLRLDFGGIGKGFAVDHALRTLPEDAGGVLIGAGGDVGVVGEAPAGGWLCDIAALPDEPAEATIALHRGALATSGLGRRQWVRGGRTLHHLIDPFTGAPGESPWRYVSVAAGSCVAAEVAAKVGWLRGYAGLDWLKELGLASRLRDRGGRVYVTGAWPLDGNELAA